MTQSESAGPIQTIADGKHISLVKRGSWEYVTRKGISGIVAIVAVTDDGRMILVEQFRPAVGKNVIELPAGLAGDDHGAQNMSNGEELIDAARRELLEETGYEAQSMELLTEGTPSAGITDEI